MGGKSQFIRTRRLSLGQQRVGLMLEWRALHSRIENGVLVATGVVQPSAITNAYRVRVTYRDNSAPVAYVLSPKLERRAEEPERPIPHTYNQASHGTERPCLYHPSSREWTPDMQLARSILPWLLSWLVDYELWHATGEWFGGGSHPDVGEEKGDHSNKDAA